MEFNNLGILERTQRMPRSKRYRFTEGAVSKWLKNDAGFLPKALNDSRRMSKVLFEYMSLVCPQNTRVTPGRITALLRTKFGLNEVLGLHGERNLSDHRHHAVDACVIAVTDQGLLQRFAKASAIAREQHLSRLVEKMPLPWGNYREHVQRAVTNIWVSHKPDHSHEGAMHNETAYGLLSDGQVHVHKIVAGLRKRVETNLKVIEISNAEASDRHGLQPNGKPRPYKGYKGDSNYCIEIVRNGQGRWKGEVISTFEAYTFVREYGLSKLRHPTLSLSQRPLVMRLILEDVVRMEIDDVLRTMRVASISGNGQVFMAEIHEANVASRTRDGDDPFTSISRMAGSMQSSKARRVTVSPIGELVDPGFKSKIP